MTFPDVTSNRDPCHGHWMTEPCKRPWHNGPPKCVQVLSRQYTLPPTLNNANGVWLADTHFVPPSGTPLSIPRTACMDRREGGPAKAVFVRRLPEHRVDTGGPGGGSAIDSRSV